MVVDILDNDCSGCHSPGNGLGVVLAGVSNAALHATLLGGLTAGDCSGGGRTLVVPGSTTTSFLIKKLSAAPGCGARMPKGGTMSAADLKTIEDWITEGAPAQ